MPHLRMGKKQAPGQRQGGGTAGVSASAAAVRAAGGGGRRGERRHLDRLGDEVEVGGADNGGAVDNDHAMTQP